MNIITTQSSRQKTTVQIAAAIAAIIPMLGLTVWMHLVRDDVPGLNEFFLGPLLFGGSMIFWLLFLHIVVCRDGLQSLGFKRHGFWADMAIGVGLGAGLLLLKTVMQPMLNSLFESRPPNAEIIQLIHGVGSDPWLLALWLGPVVWIGIAGFEELWRVFVLRRFWNVFSGTRGKWLVLILVSVLFGLAHGYQGPAGIVSIGFNSVLMGWFFMATGRTRALIVSHAVYDSVQIIMAVVAIRAAF
jgi:membrane protease YdiL (CAAX protease family)